MAESKTPRQLIKFLLPLREKARMRGACNRHPSPLPLPQGERGVVTYILSRLIRFYQWISVFWGRRCRFYPSCSEYMHESLRVYGLWKGLGYGVLRILKCHPWHPGGVDFVRIPHAK